jgi:iron complex transport system ATP-binding protein
MDTGNAKMVLTNLEIGYSTKGNKKSLIRPVNSHLCQGEVVALVGSNGTGKSTLLRTLSGFQPALSGSVLLNGQSINRLSLTERARFISFVSTEQIKVGNMTVADLVSLGRYLYSGWWGKLTNQDMQKVDECLSLTGISAFRNRFINDLSDGERQRTMIARALAQDTPVLLLDEPTAFLDIRNKFEIIHLLGNLAKLQHKAVLFSTHDLNVALGIADKIWLIHENCLVEGAPEDLLMNGSIQTMFKGSPISIDKFTGEIERSSTISKFANIKVQGDIRVWLLQALARKGFGHHPQAPIIVDYIPTDGLNSFQVIENGTISEYFSIYDLLNDIRFLA